MFEHHSDTHTVLHLLSVVCLNKFKIGSMGINMQFAVVPTKVIILLTHFAYMAEPPCNLWPLHSVQRYRYWL
jgi:hypothetical protein